MDCFFGTFRAGADTEAALFTNIVEARFPEMQPPSKAGVPGNSRCATMRLKPGLFMSDLAGFGPLAQAELIVFEGCAHAPIYEKVDEFNQRTIEFLKQHSG